MRLQPGFKLTGRVVNIDTGRPLFNTEVRSWTGDDRWAPVTTHTDEAGNFEFNTLGDATYRIFVDGANFSMNYDNQFRAGVVTNLELQVKPLSASN